MKVEILDIEEIHEIIIAFANGDFSKRLNVSEKEDLRDTIVAGVNMLGEELEQTTITRDYFSSIYNAVTDTLIVTDSELDISDINEAGCQLIGLQKENLMDANVFDHIKKNENMLSWLSDNTEKKWNFETYTLHKKIPVLCSIFKIERTGVINEGFLFTLTDITEKVDRERNRLKIIVSTQEKERKRLAYDLHDSFGQELNAIKMYLNTLVYKSEENPEFAKIFNECSNMLDQSIVNIRNMAYDLMPKSLESGNLMIALQDLAENLDALCNVEIIDDGSNDQIDKDSQIIIYRIIQEFINNSLKHSGAKDLLLQKINGNEKVGFLIQDFGNGFDMNSVKKGNGISNIQSRLKALGAEYQYESEPGNGTKLIFYIREEKS